ncbi:hypothetical protein PMAYCL1PPCAC_12339, partial [Pristionchus mayeri]
LFFASFRQVRSMSRFKKQSKQQPEEEGLLVFGYSSRIYPNDSRSELIAGESHLQPWPMDDSILIDRFDIRLLLSTVPSESKGRAELSREEEKAERECDDERWKDLHEAELESLKRMEEEEVRPKKAEFAFSYDQPSITCSSSTQVEEEEDDSEDEPFIPPSGIKLPVGLETPENQKLNHVIERTALFVVKQGAQMEIVIKAKQRNNQEQFGFLHFDHILNPYYKYIMKLIREGKYTPDIDKKKSVVNGDGLQTTQKENGSNMDRKGSANALTALMAQHGSDSESDSDCELHPSLLAGSRRGGSPDPVEKGEKAFAGPLKKPNTPPPIVMRSDYKIETANDAYSTLFKNLAKINVQREKVQEEEGRREGAEEREEREKRKETIVKEEESEESQREWEDFTQWFISFYGMSPPLPFCNMPYIPPPPDMEKALSGYARYVGENGAEAEFSLKGRVELQLHFLTPSNPHHLYYLSAVRRAEWEKEQRVDEEGVSSAVHALVPPPPPLNRKQRRMAFMEAPQVSTAPLPSVVDPTALLLATAAAPHSYHSPMGRSASSPVLVSAATSSPSYSSPLPMSPAPPIPPSSSLHSSDGDAHSGLTLLPCPVPPNISNMATSSIIAKPQEIMSERQLKARLFMEKILNDKRKKKEEEMTKGVEGMEEGEIVESEEKESREDREGRKDREKEKEKERKDEKEEKKAVSTSFFDNLIKSKMNALLKETVPESLAVEKKNEEIKESKRADDEKEKERRDKEKKEERKEKERLIIIYSEERKRKKEKKEKRRRSRSRSSSYEERRRRRRRSRSASSDLPSK